jgi:hypothetical protein
MSFNDNGDGTADFTFDPDFTQAGMYQLILSATDGVAMTADTFTVTVDECYNLVVTPDTLFFTAVEGGANPDPDTFTVSEIGGGAISFTLSESATWLTLNKAGGTTAEDVEASVDISTLTAGPYFDSVEIAGAADNSPQFAYISLEVTSPAGPTEIVLDNMTGLWAGDSVIAGEAVRWDLRLTYQPGTSDTIKGSTNGFRVWTFANGTTNYTDNFAPITYDTISIGWPSMYDIFFINPFSVDGMGADTVGFGGSRLFGTGIAAPFDAAVWWVETTPSMDGDTLCIDSSWYTPSNPWLWSTTAGELCDDPGACPAGAVGWGGPYCFHVHDTTEIVNNPPLLDSIGPKMVDEGANLNFPVTSSDPDGDALTLEIDTLYLGMNFTDHGNDTGTFDWTPDFDQAGVYQVTFSASDGALSDSETVEITVNNVNRAPVMIQPNDTTIDECMTLMMDFMASDPDGDFMDWRIQPLVANMTFTRADTVASLTFSPDTNQAGVYDPVGYGLPLCRYD